MPALNNKVEETVGGSAKDGGQSGKVALGAESNPKLIILKGTYGKDKQTEVTDVLQRAQEEQKGALKFPATADWNKVFGDPEPGADKRLTIEYCYGDDGDVLSDSFAEKHEAVSLEAEDKPTDPMIGTFTLNVHRCSDLRNVQTFGSMDPYIVVFSGNEKYKTRVHEKGHQTPQWEQSFLFNLNAGKADPQLHIQCWDKNVLTDTQIGRLDLHPNKMSGSREPVWFTLGSPSDFNSAAGKILLSCTWKGRGGPKPGKGDDVPVYIPEEQPAPAVVTVSDLQPPAVINNNANVDSKNPPAANTTTAAVVTPVTAAAVVALVDTTPINPKPVQPAPAPAPAVVVKPAEPAKPVVKPVDPPKPAVKPVQPKPTVLPVANPPPQLPTCPKRHQLTVYDKGVGPSNYRSTGFRCDKCMTIARFDSTAYYHCDKCRNYDLCLGCGGKLVASVIASGGISAPACHKGHATTEFSGRKPSNYGHASAFNCDVCSRGYNFGPQLTLFHCNTCTNWDMCLNCANKARKLKPATIINASGHVQPNIFADAYAASAAAVSASAAAVSGAGLAMGGGGGAGLSGATILCKKGHRMARYAHKTPGNYKGPNYNCDACGKGGSFNNNTDNFHCDKCTNYDMCPKCAASFAANAAE